MTEAESIQLLDRLTEHSDYHTSVFLTYGADLAFFEEAILHPLRQKGCRNSLVFMDSERYTDTIDDLRGSVTWVGQRHILIPVGLGALQSFHPKLALLLGRERGRLLVGSGNLTFTGFGHNHEVFTCLDWTPDQPDLHGLFAITWKLVRAILQRWGHSEEGDAILNKAEYVADWLLSPAEPTTEMELFHTLEEPLIDQCSRALGGEAIERITVLSPFLDEAAHALSQLYSRFHPSELRLVLQHQRTVGNAQALQDLLQAGVPLKAFRFNDDKRYLHAKVYVFETAEASYILTGSANCTRAGWLSSCANGNVEVMLLRPAGSREHFASLLEGRIGSNPLSSLEEISIRRRQVPVSERDPAAIRLLEVTVAHELLSGDYRLSSPNEDVAGLQLRISTNPPTVVSLGDCDADSQSFEVHVPSSLRESLARPLSASLWGTDVEGSPIDLGCNELWVTNVPALRRAALATTADIFRIGDDLADMFISSDSEWRDFYDSLVSLLKLDLAELQQPKPKYSSTQSSEKSNAKPDAQGPETEILLADQWDDKDREDAEGIGAAVARESEICALLEYVHGRLPSAATDGEREREQPSGRRDKRRGRKWTPDRRVARRFTNLVNKYVRGLANVQYMQALPVIHTLSYYSVFQRIVWLLYDHRVIDAASFHELVTAINTGFFGPPDGDPPALCPAVGRHVQRTWSDDWRAAKVPLYALATVILPRGPRFKGHAGEPAGEELVGPVRDTGKQDLRVLCGLAAVVGVSWVKGDVQVLAQEAAEVYKSNSNDFASQLTDYVENNLSHVDRILEKWSRRATIALGKTNHPDTERLLRRARVDYAVGRYDVLQCLQATDAQIRLCSDLIFWTTRAGDVVSSRQWGVTLVDLLVAQGNGPEAARAMFGQGEALFLGQEREEAANVLRRACLLAERLGDGKLASKCERFLGYTEFFLR